jgi:hypothetical protein
MKPIADRSAIRQAVERIKENLAGIEADRYLSTPQTIALYCWLIDCEPLNEIEPIEKLHSILISSLENQIITRIDLEMMKKICRRFLNIKNPGIAGDGRQELPDLNKTPLK